MKEKYMKKGVRKALAIMLSVAMVIAMAPTMAFAEDSADVSGGSDAAVSLLDGDTAAADDTDEAVTEETQVTETEVPAAEPAAKYVASIGETKYETLDEAVKAANSSDEGAVIDLYADQALSAVSITKPITINGNGYTVTGSKLSFPAKSETSEEPDHILTLNNVNMTLTNPKDWAITMGADASAAGCGLNIYEGSKLEITSGSEGIYSGPFSNINVKGEGSELRFTNLCYNAFMGGKTGEYINLNVTDGANFIVDKTTNGNGLNWVNVYVKDSTFTIQHVYNQAAVTCSFTFDNSNVEIYECNYGFNSSKELNFINGTKAKISNIINCGIYSYNFLNSKTYAGTTSASGGQKILVDSESSLEITDCNTYCKNYQDGYGLKSDGSTTNRSAYSGAISNDSGASTVIFEDGADVNIHDNYGRGILNEGNLTIGEGTKIVNNGLGAGISMGGAILNENSQNSYENAGNVVIGSGAVITGNTAKKYGGAIANGIYYYPNEGYSRYFGGDIKIESGAKICNNTAGEMADDIYNAGDTENTYGISTVELSSVGSDWVLDDCDDAIDGWYWDGYEPMEMVPMSSDMATVYRRWSAHSKPLYTEEYVVNDTDSDADQSEETAGETEAGNYEYGILALKAAHGIIPLTPEETSDNNTGVSKSKTATALNGNDQTTVTLTVGATENKTSSDVVFVLDKSSSVDVRNEAAAMLKELMGQAAENSINVAAVGFGGTAQEILPLTQLNSDSYDAVKDAITGKVKYYSGTNMEAGLAMAKDILDADTGVSANAKHLVLVTDGLPRMYGTGEVPEVVYVDETIAGEPAAKWADLEKNDLYHEDWLNQTDDEVLKELDDLNSWMSSHADSYEKEIDAYSTSYIDTNIQTSSDKYDSLKSVGYDEYVANEYGGVYDLALYRAAKVYVSILNEGYNCYAFCDDDYYTNTNYDGLRYDFGYKFVTNLSSLGGTSRSYSDNETGVYGLFDDVESDIIYTIGGGAVTDIIGKDFDLAMPSDGSCPFTLSVGGRTLEGNVREDGGVNQWIFSDDDYSYEVSYNGADDSFVWYIEAPVKYSEPLQLSYTLNLVNKNTAAGTYTVYTNESALLEYYDSNEEPGVPEYFERPTVSYTVTSGGGGGGGSSSGGGGGGGSTTITEPEVPLAELNKTDHFAYIIGYTDGTVKPEANITRAEVATIFFRMLTDESRNEIWSTTNDYSDVSASNWYNNAVSTLSGDNIIKGYSDGTFGGNKNITRAEFAVLASRFATDATDPNAKTFSDVEGHWAASDIARAAALGYIEGYSDGTFRPDQYITRAEAMTLMNRVLGRDTVTADDLLPSEMTIWPDNASSKWYYAAVEEATNSHDYDLDDSMHEKWTAMQEVRDWAAFEKSWSNANSASNPGEVVK